MMHEIYKWHNFLRFRVFHGFLLGGLFWVSWSDLIYFEVSENIRWKFQFAADQVNGTQNVLAFYFVSVLDLEFIRQYGLYTWECKLFTHMLQIVTH